LLAYIYVLFLLAIAGLCLQTWVTHDAFVIHGAFRGGPLAYLAQQTRHPAHVAMTTIYIILNWFADGMLLYRAYVLWRYSKYVVTGCILTLVALIGVGGFFIHTVAKAGLDLWTGGEFTPCIAYLSLSFSINLVLTVGIVGRLMYIRHELGSTLGSEAAQVYTSIAAMLVESAAPYTLVSLLAIISCARRIPMQDALLPMLGQLQAISPIMVVYRVASGRAVARES
ncbi:uncharacterized protein TRAVEDRAFT_82422, partial [Trametes versicolor FP-101664 SS1]|uniref:uncharacterized protein n=1 Tax=Trametes versicolor (strain FP-101664) TaxID=717944 RepID=UPI00046235FA